MGTEDEPLLLDRVRAAPAVPTGIAVIASGSDAERIRKICHAADLLVPIFGKTTIAHDAMQLVVVGEPSPPAPPRVVHVVRPGIGDDDLRDLLRALVGGGAIAGPASKLDDARAKPALGATRPMLTAGDAAVIETAAIAGAVKLVTADRAYFYWYEAASGTLWRGNGPSRQAFAGLVGWAARTGLAARATCAGDDARWLRELDDPDPEAKPQTRIIAQPVVAADRCVRGVIVAVRRWRHAAFAEEDGELLAKFAELAAPLVDRAVPRGSIAPPPAPHEIAAEPSTRVRAASIPPAPRAKPPTPPPPPPDSLRAKSPSAPPRPGHTLPGVLLAARAPAGGMRVPEAELGETQDTVPEQTVVAETATATAAASASAAAAATATATAAAAATAAGAAAAAAADSDPADSLLDAEASGSAFDALRARLPRWPTYALAGALAIVALAVIAALVARKPTVVRGPAIVRATKRAAVVARTAGELRALPVAVGERVEAGDVVAQLDETAQRAALDAAYRDFDTHLRAHLLDPDDAAAETALRDAAAMVERARVALADVALRAPAAGTISELHGQPGARVEVGEVVAQIAAPSGSLELIAALPAARGKGVAPTTRANAQFGDRAFDFVIERVSAPMPAAEAHRELGDVPLDGDVVVVRGTARRADGSEIGYRDPELVDRKREYADHPINDLSDGMRGTVEVRLGETRAASAAPAPGPLVEPIDVPPPPPPAAPRALAGVIAPPLAVAIAPKRAGTLVALHVRAGERVAAGQVVAELDPKPLYDDIRAAETALAAAQTAKQQAVAAVADKRDTLDTVQQQVAAGTLAQSSLDAATSALLKAQTTAQQATESITAETLHLKQAREHLADAQLRAPIDGTIRTASGATTLPTAGAALAAGTATARVQPDGALRLRFAAPPDAAPALGATLHVTLDGLTQPATAVVRDISRGLDRATGFVVIEAELDPALASQLKAGAAATIAP